MEAFFRAVIRFRWLVITLVLGSTVLAALPIQTLRFEGDVEANFPDDDPILGYNKMVEVRFGVRDLIMIGVLNDNPDENGVFNPRTLGIVKEFSEKIALLPGIKAVRDEDVASIATMDNITGTVDGMNVDPFMEAVPDAADALADLKHALFANSQFGRAEQTGQENRNSDEPLSLRFGRWLLDLAPVHTGWDTDSGFRIGFAGGAYITYHLSELVISGQVSSLITSLGAVFVLTTIMFRSVIAGLVNVIPISIVIIFSFGVMGLFNLDLEIGKALTSSMVIGIGVDYTIHFLNKYRIKVRSGLINPAEITAATMATSGKAIFFNAVVVIGGFAVFLSSSFLPNFYLGAMLMLTMSACLLVSMTVLPAMLNTFQPRFVYGAEKAPVLESRPEYGVE